MNSCRINPTSKDLTGQSDAISCTRALHEAEHAFGRSAWELSRDHYTTALRVADSSSTLLLKRAQCHFNLGEFYETIADTGKVLKIENDNIYALEMRGVSYFNIGELDAAMNHYRQGLKFDPEHNGCKSAYRKLKKIQTFLSKAERAKNSKDYETEMRNYIGILDNAPDNHPTLVPKALIDLAYAYMHAKRYSEAKEAINRVLRRDETNYIPHHVLGNRYFTFILN